MSQGFIVDKGGGVSLNFKVIGGTTQPESPAENMIWVNTDAEINGYAFSSTEPESPIVGMVWFQTGTFSLVEFNALKKNSIQVYPMSAKQYVGGKWAAKEPKSYLNGVWVGWTMYLYDSGDQCVSVTGGWTASGYDGLSVPIASGQLESDTMRFEGVNNKHVALGTVNAIDLTPYKTITFKGTIESTSANNLCLTFQITTSKSAMNDGEIAYKDTNTASGSYTATMDVSNVNRKAYIAVIAGGSSACVGTVSSIVLS